MASTNFTTHYSIPLPLGTDLTTPMDYNEAAEAIDTALFGAVTDAGNASTAAGTAVNTANTASAAVDAIGADLALEKAKIVQLQTRMTAAENDIDNVYTDVSDMITAFKESSATSTHAYAIGDYFIYNETLYKATTAIAIGTTIVPNTNCETTNVSSELKQINNDLTDLSSVVYSGGVPLISADITSAQDLTPSQPFTNFNTIKVRIGAYYSAQNTNIYMQAFDIDLRHINGVANEFMYSWYISDTNFMSVAFGIQNGKLVVNSIDLGTVTAQNFAVYVEAYGYKQTL